jgi:hypothetical protein
VALVANLAGAPQALRFALEPEHRCHCPAGAHACSCRRCAANASRAAAAAEPARPRHGPAASPRSANAAGARPPCHGGAAPAPAPETEPPQPPTDAPCLSAACGGADAVAAQPGGVDPFVLRHERARAPPARPERFAPIACLTALDPSAPEPPPPRA